MFNIMKMRDVRTATETFFRKPPPPPCFPHKFIFIFLSLIVLLLDSLISVKVQALLMGSSLHDACAIKFVTISNGVISSFLFSQLVYELYSDFIRNSPAHMMMISMAD